MAKKKGNQLYCKFQLLTEPELKSFGPKQRVKFLWLFVNEKGDTKKEKVWVTFYAWDKLAMHIVNNYHKGDWITVDRASPKVDIIKRGDQESTVLAWNVWALDEQQDVPEIPQTIDDDCELGETVLLEDDDDMPY